MIKYFNIIATLFLLSLNYSCNEVSQTDNFQEQLPGLLTIERVPESEYTITKDTLGVPKKLDLISRVVNNIKPERISALPSSTSVQFTSPVPAKGKKLDWNLKDY